MVGQASGAISRNPSTMTVVVCRMALSSSGVRSTMRIFSMRSTTIDIGGFSGLEEGVDELLGVEGGDVVRLLAGADVEDGEAKFLGDGEDDATLGGAIKLGEDDAVAFDGLGEGAGLMEPVLAGDGVEGEEDSDARVGDVPSDNAP